MLLEGAPDAEGGADPAAAGAGSAGSGTGAPAEEGFCPSYALGIRHTRTKLRHTWTNGFVERLQGTILQEHWRVAFRRRYFTSWAALQRSLDGFMRFYNADRPHQGYRLRGQTPSALFWRAVHP